jgi:hypothetical protein
MPQAQGFTLTSAQFVSIGAEPPPPTPPSPHGSWPSLGHEPQKPTSTLVPAHSHLQVTPSWCALRSGGQSPAPPPPAADVESLQVDATPRRVKRHAAARSRALFMAFTLPIYHRARKEAPAPAFFCSGRARPALRAAPSARSARPGALAAERERQSASSLVILPPGIDILGAEAVEPDRGAPWRARGGSPRETSPIRHPYTPRCRLAHRWGSAGGR